TARRRGGPAGRGRAPDGSRTAVRGRPAGDPAAAPEHHDHGRQAGRIAGSGSSAPTIEHRPSPPAEPPATLYREPDRASWWAGHPSCPEEAAMAFQRYLAEEVAIAQADGLYSRRGGRGGPR